MTRTGSPLAVLPEYLDDLPNLCGQEQLIAEAIAAGRARPGGRGQQDIASAPFAVALHMHQPGRRG